MHDTNVHQCLREFWSEITNQRDLSGWEDYFLPTSPQQTNYDDCGVFMLKGIEVLSRGDTLDFNGQDIQNMRQRMYLELTRQKLLPLPTCP